MACHLYGAKPLFEPMMIYYQLDCKQFQWNYNKNIWIINQEKNAIANVVCKMSAILLQAQYI